MKCIAFIFGILLSALSVEGGLQGVLKKTPDQKRGFGGCKALGEECTGVRKCCGTTQCYWEDGYRILEYGKCVECVTAGKKCQRDSQCCAAPDALQCDKGGPLWLDGTCEKYRAKGVCYRDGQCVKGCKKKWYQARGVCE